MEVKIYAKQIKVKEQAVYAKYYLQNNNSNIIGQIDVKYCAMLKNNIEMKYQIFKAFTGKGFASKSVELVLKDIFINKALDGISYKNVKGEPEKTVFKKIHIQIAPDNIASIKVAKKNGFSLSKKPNGYVGDITPEMFKQNLENNQVLGK